MRWPQPRLVSGVSPFRLFGRPPESEPALDPGDGGVTWAPGPWDQAPGPATRHARPVAFDRGADRVDFGFASRDVVGEDVLGRDVAGGDALGRDALGGDALGGDALGGDADDDPPTDPHGFPPIPAEPAATWGFTPRAVAPVPPARLDPAEAAALAGAFAADYLSWDEDDPGRRGRALADHLAVPVGDPALLGWDGRGRQRAELALPGGVRPDGDDRVLVDVRVRVTPYRAVGDRTADRTGDVAEAAESEPDVLGVPAAAPAPTGRGWRGCASYWVRLSVPVVREDGRLAVDAAEEAGPDIDAARADDAGIDDARADTARAEVRELRVEPPAAAPGPTRPPTRGPEPESAW